MLKPQAGGLRPCFYQPLLRLVYLPIGWAASFAAFSIATCCKASSRVARDDGRPNERRASLAELVWATGNYEVTEDKAYTTISVTGDVTLTIAEDVTLSASQGITIADGATLTIYGPGTLNVSNSTEAAAGANADSGSMTFAGKGEEGYPGIAGNVVVNSGTFNVTGGQGGQGGKGGKGVPNAFGAFSNGGMGGFGGAGISGSLIVNGGTVYITGGTGGTGGTGSKGGKGGTGGKGISGSLTVNGGTVIISGGQEGDGAIKSNNGTTGDDGDRGQALGGTVTCTASHGIQERNDKGTWNYLASGSTSDKNYVRVVENTPLTLYDDTDNTSAIETATTDLMPRTVTLSGRTLAKDGYWNTLCLPFPLSADQVTALLGTNGTLMEMDTDGEYSGHKTGLAVVPPAADEDVRAPKGRRDGRAPGWHTLDGRPLDGKPTARGLYIVNGKKVVVK